MGVELYRRRNGQAARAASNGAGVVLIVFAALSLAGCSGTTHSLPVAGGTSTAGAAQPVATAETADAPALQDSDGADDQPAALPAASYEKADPADPDEVMGLGRGEVEDLLGEPGLVRHEAPAEVWQYQSRGCVLDVFLYEASAEYQVVYLEARTGQALTAATASCLGAVMDERRQTPTS
jgi:hypothetical protein